MPRGMLQHFANAFSYRGRPSQRVERIGSKMFSNERLDRGAVLEVELLEDLVNAQSCPHSHRERSDAIVASLFDSNGFRRSGGIVISFFEFVAGNQRAERRDHPPAVDVAVESLRG